MYICVKLLVKTVRTFLASVSCMKIAAHHLLQLCTVYGLKLIRVGDGVADKSWCDRVYDSVWPHSLQKNTRQEEEFYKETLLRCANENFPQEDT